MLDRPTMFEPAQVAPEIIALPAWAPIPGLGVLAINSFVVRGRVPVLIDTGAGPLRPEFLERLGQVIDPADLQYIWLTHADPDHTGAIEQLIAAAPRARVAIHFLGAAKLALYRTVPDDRLHFMNPGDRLQAGNRELIAMRPPTYDAPETLAVFDRSTRTLFSADSFGALLETPCPSAAELPPARLRDGLVTWAGIDSPWLADVNRSRFEATLDKYRGLDAEIVLSAHLPVANRMATTLLGYLATAPAACAGAAPNESAAAALKAE